MSRWHLGLAPEIRAFVWTTGGAASVMAALLFFGAHRSTGRQAASMTVAVIGVLALLASHALVPGELGVTLLAGAILCFAPIFAFRRRGPLDGLVVFLVLFLALLLFEVAGRAALGASVFCAATISLFSPKALRSDPPLLYLILPIAVALFGASATLEAATMRTSVGLALVRAKETGRLPMASLWEGDIAKVEVYPTYFDEADVPVSLPSRPTVRSVAQLMVLVRGTGEVDALWVPPELARFCTVVRPSRSRVFGPSAVLTIERREGLVTFWCD